MSSLAELGSSWNCTWRQVQDLLLQLHRETPAAVLALHLRTGLWLHLQAAGIGRSSAGSEPPEGPQGVEQVFPWSPQVAQAPVLPGGPSAQALWRRIAAARVLPPGPKLPVQVYTLVQLLGRCGVPQDELTALRWHLRLEEALEPWQQQARETRPAEDELPWLFPPPGGFPAEALPDAAPAPSPVAGNGELPAPDAWDRRLARALALWDQGDHGGQVVRELLAGWADAQRRKRSDWTGEQSQLFARVHQLLDGTRPWELLPRASAVLETESWPQRCQELTQRLFAAECPAGEIVQAAWELVRALDDAELVLYAGRRLARINAQLAQRIEQQRLGLLRQPGVLLAAWPVAQVFAQSLDRELPGRDYELAQTTAKFQALDDHQRAMHWRLSFAEPLPWAQATAEV